MSYAEGFDYGERLSYKHRQTGERLPHVESIPRSDWQRGLFDGYRPRSVEWGARACTRAAPTVAAGVRPAQ